MSPRSEKLAASAYKIVKPGLFRVDAESVHERTFQLLETASRSPSALSALGNLAPGGNARLETSAFGRDFPFPVGIAAGLDKSGTAWPALAALGFGFVEIGTVTLRPQQGNQRPRVFRIPEQEALINCMGFPGPGVEVVANSLTESSSKQGILGVSIGPNRDAVDLQSALAECAETYERLAPFADFAVINPSSPNTPGLRNLLRKPAIGELLDHLARIRCDIGGPPLAVKISPDLEDPDIDDVVAAALDAGIEGIVATNTTNALPPELSDRHNCAAGGLSGRPLAKQAAHAVGRIASYAEDQLTIIAAGGIFTGRDVVAAVMYGATLVQVYTGFIYRGPTMPAAISREILSEMDRLGVDRLEDLRAQATR